MLQPTHSPKAQKTYPSNIFIFIKSVYIYTMLPFVDIWAQTRSIELYEVVYALLSSHILTSMLSSLKIRDKQRIYIYIYLQLLGRIWLGHNYVALRNSHTKYKIGNLNPMYQGISWKAIYPKIGLVQSNEPTLCSIMSTF